MKKEKGIYHKTFYCSDLGNCSDGDRIFDIFLLSDVRYCSNDRGIKWLDIKLDDRTGSMRAKIWSDRIKMEYEGFCGQIVIVSGKINYYAGNPQMSIEQMQLAKDGEFALSELVRTLGKAKIKMYIEQMLSMVEMIESKDIKQYVKCFINDEMLQNMAVLPVNLKGHHAYRGGLLEHVCEVVTMVYHQMKSTEPVRELKYDKDLALAAALLHDIGCLKCYSENGYSHSVENSARLLGNAHISHAMLLDAKVKYSLNEDTYALLMHIIDASHGSVEPMTMEAMIVKSMNCLSAEIEMYENSCVQSELFMQKSDFIWSKDLKREISKVRRERSARE